MFFKLNTILFLLLLSPYLLADHGYEDGANSDYKDCRNFTTNTTVTVLLNHETFTKQGFPETYTRTEMERVIAYSLDRWQSISGFRLNLRYRGTTTRTKAEDREIIIKADEWDKAEASATRSGEDDNGECKLPLNKSDITFFKKNPVGTRTWTLINSETSFIGVLMHELGHSFGLGHNNDFTNKTLMQPYAEFTHGFGPYREDVDDLIDMYSYLPQLTFKVYSMDKNDANNFSNFDTNIFNQSSNMFISPTIIRDDNYSMMFYTQRDKKPAFRFTTDSKHKEWNSSKYINDQTSHFGVGGDGWNDEYMMTWATKNLDLKVLRSNDGGDTWHWRNPPAEKVYNTPSLHKLDNNTWILLFTSLTANSGNIYYYLSSDDGKNWGTRKKIFDNNNRYLPIGNIYITSVDKNNIWISYVTRMTNGSDDDFGRMVYYHTKLNDQGQLELRGSRYGSVGRDRGNFSLFSQGNNRYGYIDLLREGSENGGDNIVELLDDSGKRYSDAIIDADNFFIPPVVATNKNSEDMELYLLEK